MRLIDLRDYLKKCKKKELIEFLHEFLLLKQGFLEENGIDVDYWKEKDKKILKNLEKRDLIEAVNYMLWVARLSHLVAPFTKIDCPFCYIFEEDCYSCSYGEEKEQCSVANSVYQQVKEQLFMLKPGMERLEERYFIWLQKVLQTLARMED